MSVFELFLYFFFHADFFPVFPVFAFLAWQLICRPTLSCRLPGLHVWQCLLCSCGRAGSCSSVPWMAPRWSHVSYRDAGCKERAVVSPLACFVLCKLHFGLHDLWEERAVGSTVGTNSAWRPCGAFSMC